MLQGWIYGKNTNLLLLDSEKKVDYEKWLDHQGLKGAALALKSLFNLGYALDIPQAFMSNRNRLISVMKYVERHDQPSKWMLWYPEKAIKQTAGGLYLQAIRQNIEDLCAISSKASDHDW